MARLLCLFLLCLAGSIRAQDFSLILEGGTVYDGLGGPPVVADVGFAGDRIAVVGDLAGRAASRRLDVAGLAVAPGFIDIHSHATATTFVESGIARRPLAENELRQGVTTVLGGQDGSSPFPIGAFLREVEAHPPAVNVGLFVGHGTLRGRVVGQADRPPTPAERQRMEAMVAGAMADGAFGLSSGLEYTPGAFAATDELVALARVAGVHGGLYISHIRDEGGRLLESIAEVIRIAEEGGLPAQVTHLKVIGKRRWGRSADALRLLDEARARGIDVAADQYPYTASSTGLTILFPDWSKAGGTEALRNRLAEPAARARIRADIVKHLDEERGGDPATVVAADCPWDASLNGKSLADILAGRGLPGTLDNAADVAMELQEKGGCTGVFHSMSEADVRRIMVHPMTMISSDGGIPEPGAGMPHPRNYGAFARVLGRYVRARKVLSLPEAIRKMTSLPARRLGLDDRGVLRPGAVADVVVFDPAAVADHATFASPHQYATGVRHLFVAGQAVLRDGTPTGARPGRALRHRLP